MRRRSKSTGSEPPAEEVDTKRPRSRRQHQHQIRLNPDQIRKLVSEYQEGLTVLDLAVRYRIHRTTVLAVLRREKVPPRTGVIDRNIDEAKQLYELGWSLSKVGQHLGVDAETVRRGLMKAGVVIRQRRGWKH